MSNTEDKRSRGERTNYSGERGAGAKLATDLAHSRFGKGPGARSFAEIADRHWRWGLGAKELRTLTKNWGKTQTGVAMLRALDAMVDRGTIKPSVKIPGIGRVTLPNFTSSHSGFEKWFVRDNINPYTNGEAAAKAAAINKNGLRTSKTAFKNNASQWGVNDPDRVLRGGEDAPVKPKTKGTTGGKGGVKPQPTLPRNASPKVSAAAEELTKAGSVQRAVADSARETAKVPAMFRSVGRSLGKAARYALKHPGALLFGKHPGATAAGALAFQGGFDGYDTFKDGGYFDQFRDVMKNSGGEVINDDPRRPNVSPRWYDYLTVPFGGNSEYMNRVGKEFWKNVGDSAMQTLSGMTTGLFNLPFRLINKEDWIFLPEWEARDREDFSVDERVQRANDEQESRNNLYRHRKNEFKSATTYTSGQDVDEFLNNAYAFAKDYGGQADSLERRLVSGLIKQNPILADHAGFNPNKTEDIRIADILPESKKGRATDVGMLTDGQRYLRQDMIQSRMLADRAFEGAINSLRAVAPEEFEAQMKQRIADVVTRRFKDDEAFKTGNTYEPGGQYKNADINGLYDWLTEQYSGVLQRIDNKEATDGDMRLMGSLFSGNLPGGWNSPKDGSTNAPQGGREW